MWPAAAPARCVERVPRRHMARPCRRFQAFHRVEKLNAIRVVRTLTTVYTVRVQHLLYRSYSRGRLSLSVPVTHCVTVICTTLRALFVRSAVEDSQYPRMSVSEYSLATASMALLEVYSSNPAGRQPGPPSRRRERSLLRGSTESQVRPHTPW